VERDKSGKSPSRGRNVRARARATTYAFHAQNRRSATIERFLSQDWPLASYTQCHTTEAWCLDKRCGETIPSLNQARALRHSGYLNARPVGTSVLGRCRLGNARRRQTSFGWIGPARCETAFDQRHRRVAATAAKSSHDFESQMPDQNHGRLRSPERRRAVGQRIRASLRLRRAYDQCNLMTFI
jgi:hypothetical protein